MVAEPSQYSSDFGHSFKMKINEISLYFNGLRFHLSILPKSNYLPLCCYAGTAFIDTVSITKANVKVLEDGDKWLVYNRKKTGTLARVKLLPEALELMAKYEDGARDTLFPLLSTNRVRIDLITICKLAETSKTYSYHSGRHSFASLITLEAGVPMETICKMLGHKDVKMTQRYARVTQKKLFEDMDKFIAATEKDFILAL